MFLQARCVIHTSWMDKYKKRSKPAASHDDEPPQVIKKLKFDANVFKHEEDESDEKEHKK